MSLYVERLKSIYEKPSASAGLGLFRIRGRGRFLPGLHVGRRHCCASLQRVRWGGGGGGAGKMSELPKLSLDKFEIQPRLETRPEGARLRLMWRGEMALRDPSVPIAPYLEKCLTSTAANVCVILDFTQVAFMNSSSLLPVIAFVKRVDALHRSCELCYSNAVGWQRVSYNSMKVLCQRLAGVKVVYGGDSA